MPHRIENQRLIINRKLLQAEIMAMGQDGGRDSRNDVLLRLRQALNDGRAEISNRLQTHPGRGHESAIAQSFLIDQIIRIIYDYIVRWHYPVGNYSAGEKLALMAVGGYGRGEMAPHSDVDIAFITPLKKNSWTEQVTEAMLYLLWDLQLKVGQSSRSVDEMVRLSADDLTIRTSLLEGRFIWGDKMLYGEASQRFWNDVVIGTEREFVAQKLEERENRHHRMGDSRYVVEPNVKEGKGGLRDLQTLYWIGKYIHKVRSAAELVDAGLLSKEEYYGFRRAANFFWAVRCHLHDINNRADDRLTFDMQREVAERMNFAPITGKLAVERFMQYYFLNAKQVGDLTGVFLAQLDDKMSATGRRLFPAITRRPRKLKSFKTKRGQIILPHDEFFRNNPVRLVQMFQLADRHNLQIHPSAIRQANRDAALIDNHVRIDKDANAMFLDVLTSPRDPETVLRWMNESGVFGRFMPDFGKVVAQMQFDMYHHYTVDEHTIRAIGLLTKIESGALKEDHPLATAIMHKLHLRRVLYVATLMHDIAKGRGGDHSILGAEIAETLCPRLGLDDAETELVAWLVRHHLLMSSTAFRRDLTDYKTIADFGAIVKSPERLKLLLVLTIVDIRAVGPGVWNSWKRQLLGGLFEATEEMLRLGHKQHGRKERIIAKKQAVFAQLSALKNPMPQERFDALSQQLDDAYWIAEPEDIIIHNLPMLDMMDDEPLKISLVYYKARGATLVSILAADHPGLFYRMAGAIHLAGGNIIDARIHTTSNGMAIDNFLVQDPLGRPLREDNQLERLSTAIEDALANRHKLMPRLIARPLAHPSAETFRIKPLVVVDNDASNRFTVVEVNAHDRPALLYRLAYALFNENLIVHSAHIATYGERAVDTFYLTDLLGAKITQDERQQSMREALLESVREVTEEPAKMANNFAI